MNHPELPLNDDKPHGRAIDRLFKLMRILIPKLSPREFTGKDGERYVAFNKKNLVETFYEITAILP